MRLTEFWRRMDEAFGATTARTLAQDHVLARLGNRTVNQSLAAGQDAKAVWAAVVVEMELPPPLR